MHYYAGFSQIGSHMQMTAYIHTSLTCMLACAHTHKHTRTHTHTHTQRDTDPSIITHTHVHTQLTHTYTDRAQNKYIPT